MSLDRSAFFPLVLFLLKNKTILLTYRLLFDSVNDWMKLKSTNNEKNIIYKKKAQKTL